MFSEYPIFLIFNRRLNQSEFFLLKMSCWSLLFKSCAPGFNDFPKCVNMEMEWDGNFLITLVLAIGIPLLLLFIILLVCLCLKKRRVFIGISQEEKYKSGKNISHSLTFQLTLP